MKDIYAVIFDLDDTLLRSDVGYEKWGLFATHDYWVK